MGGRVGDSALVVFFEGGVLGLYSFSLDVGEGFRVREIGAVCAFMSLLWRMMCVSVLLVIAAAARIKMKTEFLLQYGSHNVQ